MKSSRHEGSHKGSQSADSQAPSIAEPHVTSTYEWKIVWVNVVAFIYLHAATVYGLYLCFSEAKLLTFLFGYFVSVYSGLGITAGAHRLWAHKSYKAKAPLRLLLAFFNASAFQNHIYEWVRDHRVHHKFTDTDADPHNSKRGFFFSHVGWLMVKKHNDVKTRGKTVDMSDLERDWVVMYQKKYYFFLMPLCTFVIPTVVPVYCWAENLRTAWYVCALMRYTLVLNGTWLVNSAAHTWGSKPYDHTISSRQNVFVSVVTNGEGWHNYHHAFPWDYKTSEFSGYRTNMTSAFIDCFAWLGWAYDLRTVSPDTVARRAHRTGDGSHELSRNVVWGWDDEDLTERDREIVEVIKPKENRTRRLSSFNTKNG